MRKIIFLTIFIILISGCEINKNIDEKMYCNNRTDCVNRRTCEDNIEGNPCVNYEWWNKNIGHELDCDPEPNCNCMSNTCFYK